MRRAHRRSTCAWRTAPSIRTDLICDRDRLKPAMDRNSKCLRWGVPLSGSTEWAAGVSMLTGCGLRYCSGLGTRGPAKSYFSQSPPPAFNPGRDIHEFGRCFGSRTYFACGGRPSTLLKMVGNPVAYHPANETLAHSNSSKKPPLLLGFSPSCVRAATFELGGQCRLHFRSCAL